ncbi:SH3 domain-containing protein [Sporosarcina ureae]|uniref:SH3 domain-containing protein n=1 Tax=Sporosarcina ureae TaxID=1571 RepID=UPI0026F1CB7A|nr:SH3 domain-containing protein [Sporosarcina ureae]
MEKRSTSSKNAKGNKNKIILAILSVAVIAVSVFLFAVIKDNKTIKQADSLVAIGKYENGIAIYDTMLTKKYSDDVMAKRENAIELMEANENYERGIESLDHNDRYKALKYFSKVPENDTKLYEKATTELQDIEDMTAAEIEELIGDQEFDEAHDIVNAYLKAAPGSTRISTLKDTLLATEKDVTEKNAVAKAEEDQKIAQAKSEEEKQAKAVEDEKRKQEAIAIASAKSKETNKWELEQARITGANLVNKTLYTTSKIANLRDAPTLGGNVGIVLSKGTEVYILETHVESASRTWCKVRAYTNEGSYVGWISYNTMNNSIP